MSVPALSAAVFPDPRQDRLHALKGLLEEKFPSATPVVPVPDAPPAIGLEGVTRLLPAGGMAELVGSSGGGGLFLEAMLLETRRQKRLLGLIDAASSFDPQGRSEAALERLLVVFCRSVAQAVKAVDLLLRDGNLPLVVLDLQLVPARELNRVPASTWYRFQRLVETTGAVFVVLSIQPVVRGARVRLALEGGTTLAAMRCRRHALLERMQVRVFQRARFSDLGTLTEKAG